MSRYRAGATGPCLANGNLQRFPLTSSETSDRGYSCHPIILTPVAVRRGVTSSSSIYRYTTFSRDFLAFCREGGYLRKQRQGGGASDIHPRPRFHSFPLSLPLSWGGIALPPPYLHPQRHPFCTLRPDDPAVARSCRQSSPEDSAIRTSALASFPRRALREIAIFRLLSYVHFYNDSRSKSFFSNHSSRRVATCKQ